MNLPTKFKLNPINAQKRLNRSEAMKKKDFGGARPKVDQARRDPARVCPPNLSTIKSVVCLKMRGKGQGNGGNLVEHDQISISPDEAPNYFAHQICTRSDRHFS